MDLPIMKPRIVGGYIVRFVVLVITWLMTARSVSPRIMDLNYVQHRLRIKAFSLLKRVLTLGWPERRRTLL